MNKIEEYISIQVEHKLKMWYFASNISPHNLVDIVSNKNISDKIRILFIVYKRQLLRTIDKENEIKSKWLARKLIRSLTIKHNNKGKKL